jgi:hypothetical protein
LDDLASAGRPTFISTFKGVDMRKATKTAAMWFGVTAGLAALEHGYFEVLQGNVRPAGVMFPSWGADICDPTQAWHACEPAMSLLPSFLLSGILTILLSLTVIVWSGWFLQHKRGGLILISWQSLCFWSAVVSSRP